MALDDGGTYWFNLRSTTGFVTDGANQVGVPDATSFPTGVSIAGGTTNVGYDTALTALQSRDRTTSGDVRLAGMQFVNQNGTQIAAFKITLASPGTWNVYIGGCDTYSVPNEYLAIYDNTTLLTTCVDSVPGPGANQSFDAAGNLWTSRAAWASSQVGAQLTFSTTTFSVRLGKTATTNGNAAVLSTIGLQKVLSASAFPPVPQSLSLRNQLNAMLVR